LATKVACNFIFFVIIESFIIVAYDLELFGGIFHNANSLGTSWGLVFLAGYYLQDQDLSALILAISFMVYLCSMQGIELYEKGKSYGRDRNHQDANAKLAWKTLRMGILAVDGITLVLVTYRLFLI
jgi:4-hydroxybenzoate polyprenyltransferase